MVRWMLEEIGCPYDTVVLDYEPASKDDRWGGAALARPGASDKDHRRARFFNDINPIGKIPAIEHDGRVITETAAICAYLAQAFPEAGLAPTPAELADYYRWLFFAAGPVEQAVTNHRAGFAPPARTGILLRSWQLRAHGQATGVGGAGSPVYCRRALYRR